MSLELDVCTAKLIAVCQDAVYIIDTQVSITTISQCSTFILITVAGIGCTRHASSVTHSQMATKHPSQGRACSYTQWLNVWSLLYAWVTLFHLTPSYRYLWMFVLFPVVRCCMLLWSILSVQPKMAPSRQVVHLPLIHVTATKLSF